MPDVEVLMEAWPPEFEAILGNMDVLTPELDISLEEYARTVRSKCSLGMSGSTRVGFICSDIVET